MLWRPASAKVQRGQSPNNLLGFEGDGDDLADEAEDVLRVVGAVGVVDDAGAFVGRDLVLVDDPFDGGAIAEAVVEGGGGDPAEEEEVVVAEFGFVFRELHLFDADMTSHLGSLICFERAGHAGEFEKSQALYLCSPPTLKS
jgi:hypothetical protein